MELFSISNIIFTVLGYPMSYIEFFGVLANAICVWLVAKKKIATWPIGILGAFLFMAMFWQIQLYSDSIMQVYYIVTGFYGWYFWNKTKEDNVKQTFRFSSSLDMYKWIVLGIISTFAWGYFMANAHTILPSIFTLPAAFPYTDAGILVASFIANWLMIKKKIECWIYWVLIDIVSIYVYFVKGMVFTSLLYVVFFFMASNGLRLWLKNRAPQEDII